MHAVMAAEPDRQPAVGDADAEAVRRVHAGDQAAWELLIARHLDTLRAAVARMLTRAADIDEVVQDTLVLAWRDIAVFDPARPFAPWLRGICRHRTAEFLRRRAARRAHQAAIVDRALVDRLTVETEPACTPIDRLEALARCLERLGPAQRDLLDQRYRQLMPLREIAARRGSSEAAVGMLLARLREALAACLRRRGITA